MYKKVKLNHEGIDQYGCMWTPFEVDYFAMQEDGTCAICGATLQSGYLCLDGGDEVCDKHVSIKER